MPTLRVSAAGVVSAPPAVVYRVLSDYVRHHPRILPKPYFESLAVEQGGVGAGTVVRVEMKVLGTRASFRLRVTEPEPGRVLREEDAEKGIVTTFTVDQADGGRRSRVTISTESPARGGLAGLAERLVNPPITRAIYRKELRLLDEHARALA